MNKTIDLSRAAEVLEDGFREWMDREFPRADGLQIDFAKTVWMAAMERATAKGAEQAAIEDQFHDFVVQKCKLAVENLDCAHRCGIGKEVAASIEAVKRGVRE